MRNKPYYSIRTGKNPLSKKYGLDPLKLLFRTLFNKFEADGYFQEYFGYHCVDDGEVPGKLGYNLSGALLLELRKENLTPIYDKIDLYSEDDLFDIIEFLYEHCSKPIDGRYHSFGNCGWHYAKFERQSGQTSFRQELNRILELYDNGYELSSDGEILRLADDGLGPLLEAPVPTSDIQNVESRVASAVKKFRRYRSSMEERRDAIRDLADVLEFLRPELKNSLTSQDESDLFNIANNFGIRHHNASQKTTYDKPIWYSWLFYYYLATIHAAIRLIDKKSGAV